jgi:hypothetical protein
LPDAINTLILSRARDQLCQRWIWQHYTNGAAAGGNETAQPIEILTTPQGNRAA